MNEDVRTLIRITWNLSSSINLNVDCKNHFKFGIGINNTSICYSGSATGNLECAKP